MKYASLAPPGPVGRAGRVVDGEHTAPRPDGGARRRLVLDLARRKERAARKRAR